VGTHWPVGADPTAKAQRSQSVHLIGNLTLLTGRLNTKISHGPWAGEHGKWAALEKHDVLLLNRHVRQLGATGWDEQRIRHRTETLIDLARKHGLAARFMEDWEELPHGQSKIRVTHGG